ncbi:MAG: response regulator [Candidatus Nealsonbacteria bacterium]|nr:response regulator [Candidatus Nealsonbacteria bacterium]
MLREIKKDYPDLPIIIFSELGQESDIEEAQSIRVSDYFIKSKSTVDQVVERSKKILK